MSETTGYRTFKAGAGSGVVYALLYESVDSTWLKLMLSLMLKKG